MAVTDSTMPWAASSMPELRFAVEGATCVDHAAVPTIAFTLSVEASPGRRIRSLLLDIQIQIAARQRAYGERERGRLLELFGTPERWRSTLRTLLWTRTSASVPPFSGSTVIEVPVMCSYDLEVGAARYLAALEEGAVPLELLLSGTMFYDSPAGALQAARIAWDHELSYHLPVSVWREAIDRHFPNSAWIRLSRDRFDRLWAYRSRHVLQSWDRTIDALLSEPER